MAKKNNVVTMEELENQVEETTDVVETEEVVPKKTFKEKVSEWANKERTFSIAGVGKKVVIGVAAVGGVIVAGKAIFDKVFSGSDEGVETYTVVDEDGEEITITEC